MHSIHQAYWEYSESDVITNALTKAPFDQAGTRTMIVPKFNQFLYPIGS